MTNSENALTDMRIEWATEDTPGVPPTDPEFNPFSGEIDELSASIDGTKEATSSLGYRDFIEMYRGPEESELTASYAQYNFPVDASGNVVDPIAYPLTVSGNGDYPSLTVTSRREVSGGGADGAGFREYLVVLGARPTASTVDGDPSAAQALPQELTLPSKTIRPHIIHQPSAETELVVRSTDPNDTNTVTIESEGASTTTDVDLPGSDPNTVATTMTFGDIDAIWVDGEHAGDIMVGTDDGSGNIDVELLQKPLTGYNTDGVDSVPGVPALGGGSHATEPAGPGTIFLGTQSEWADAEIGERVHTLNLSVDVESSREPVQSSRQQAIDVGMRSVELDADIAGPYESSEKILAHFRDKTGDLIYGFGDDPSADPSNADKQIVAKNVEIIDAPDFTRTAEDTNYIPSVTFRAVGDPAIEVINNS
jgi:hypothetical protein